MKEPVDLADLRSRAQFLVDTRDDDAALQFGRVAPADVLALHAALVQYRQGLERAAANRPSPGVTLQESYERGRWHAASDALAAFDAAVRL